MAKKQKLPNIDGLGPKDKERIRKALRQVWQWSHARKLCIAANTDKDGFGICENCFRVVPKVYADHIHKVGAVDSGFIERLFCSSKYLQGLCKHCHDKKTRQERKEDNEIM